MSAMRGGGNESRFEALADQSRGHAREGAAENRTLRQHGTFVVRLDYVFVRHGEAGRLGDANPDPWRVHACDGRRLRWIALHLCPNLCSDNEIPVNFRRSDDASLPFRRVRPDLPDRRYWCARGRRTLARPRSAHGADGPIDLNAVGRFRQVASSSDRLRKALPIDIQYWNTSSLRPRLRRSAG